MKNRILAFLLVLIVPFYIFAIEGLNTTIFLDYSNKGLERLNVKFTSTGVNATAQTQLEVSNYLDYADLKDLTYEPTPGNSKSGISLKPEFTSTGELIAVSKTPCYISWQTYTKDSAKVYLAVEDVMRSENGQVDWTVYMDPATQNNQVSDSANAGSKILVVTTIPGNFGVTGSRQFHVKTHDLLNKPFGAYKANIVATVEAK